MFSRSEQNSLLSTAKFVNTYLTNSNENNSALSTSLHMKTNGAKNDTSKEKLMIASKNLHLLIAKKIEQKILDQSNQCSNKDDASSHEQYQESAMSPLSTPHTSKPNTQRTKSAFEYLPIPPADTGIKLSSNNERSLS